MITHSKIRKTILCAIPALMSLTGVAQAVTIEGNAAVASNYIWRGMTQSDDKAAVSGGLDVSGDSGLYAGTWVSNIDFGTAASYELDLYAGYAGESGDFSYDIGYIAYLYPDAGIQDYDFAEMYLSLGYGAASVTYSYQVTDSADFMPKTQIIWPLDMTSHCRTISRHRCITAITILKTLRSKPITA